MPRRYRNIPGKGLTWAAYDEELYPMRRGVPRNPRKAALKSRVMQEAWKLFKSGEARSMSEAMRMAYRKVR